MDQAPALSAAKKPASEPSSFAGVFRYWPSTFSLAPVYSATA